MKSASGGGHYDRYKALYDNLEKLVVSELRQTDDGDEMWKINVLPANDKGKTLLPHDVETKNRKARLGSMEIILAWRSAGKTTRVRGRTHS